MADRDERDLVDAYRPSVIDSVDWRAYLAGLTFIAALAAGGRYIQIQAASEALLQNYAALLVSLFIGASTGHYYGKAMEEAKESINSAYLGIFTFLFAYWLYQNQISLLSATLILITISLILGHDSTLIADSIYIQKLVSYFAEGLSPAGLILFGVLKFVSPAIPFNAITQTVVASLSQNVTILSAQINIVVFAVSLIIGIPLAFYIFSILTGTNTTNTQNR